eukprot:gene10977-16874_t
MLKSNVSGSGALYVGDLHSDVNEAVLFETFKDLGPIISIRICRDTQTRRSLGYAYVNFQNPIDAERAIETQNHVQIKGSAIRVMWSQRDPALRRSGVGNVFVKGLAPSVDSKTLHDTFSAHGNILSCKVVLDSAGQSRGFGFVHYDGEEAARKAVEELSGILLHDSKLFVGPFIRRAQRLAALNANFTNVYVKEIVDMDATELKEKFSKFGEITSACTKKEPRLGDKTFGFVNFASHDMAVKAIEEWHGKEIDGLTREGCQLYCQRAMKRAERELEVKKRALVEKARRQFPHGNNLYVKNLDEAMDDEALEAMFSVFGKITSAVVMRNFSTKATKGFGFVCFNQPEDAQKALAEMNGKIFGTKPLYVNIAQKKDARRSMLELQYAQRRSMPPPPFMYNPMYFQPGMPPMGGPPGFGGYGPPPPPGKGFGMRGGGKMGRGVGGRGGYGRGGSARGRAHAAPRYQHEEPAPPADDAIIAAESLAAMTPEQQKNALGEQLFRKIQETDISADIIPKVTG